jgi:hypothetical protein
MSNVSDVKRKAVKITLNDGVEREIKFTLNALAELEDKFGSVQKAFDKLEKENSMKALRTILWAGFLHKEPDITEQQVGNLIDLAYMQDLTNSLNLAFEQDMATTDNTSQVQSVPAESGTAPNA